MKKIGIGLLGLGTVGKGVANIISNPNDRHPLVGELELIAIAVRNLQKRRDISFPASILTTNAIEIINNPNIQIVVEVMGGIEPAKSLIIQAIRSGKSVVTANKAVIARHGEEIANEAKAAGVYVLIEAAVGGGIPIIEPLKQSLGGNQITKVSGIINGTTNYILSRMDKEGANYSDVLKDAQELGYAESDPAADVEGSDAADKIAILSGLAFGGTINRADIPTKGINSLEAIDVNYARKLGYGIKLLAISEKGKAQSDIQASKPLSIWVEPTLVPEDNPLAGVNGVNNAILVEGNPIGQVMFFGPGAGSGPTASAVVADILNIAGIQSMSEEKSLNLDPLLSAKSWRSCHVAEEKEISKKNYIRLIAEDAPGVIGQIGTIFGQKKISIESIVQFDAINNEAEIVVITHKIKLGKLKEALSDIQSLPQVKRIGATMGCL
ncbi:homoserine dehydrogenase [Prochlorococcus marinus]|uniref:Homoserine dehydrogenase n=1 Tax=Prochlorococcus marinus XMU1408 TaxID=2213228 RepID=A0A318RED2_PROMR|nr:homoserine dehydrogenase [Prochlorococcus marinus]MBW3042309.1 homoserine dehydrogenase [Prochlorococcus marinus str. XMU1408]PYE01695.1 homoserine dehydrogenase [Prochlorococcus marinus XMU1408]